MSYVVPQPALAEAKPAVRTLSIATVLMGLSGFAGLGYQIVWTEQFGVWLGHDIVAVLAVVAAFFGGLGAGASLLARQIARSAFPARWYAGCEFAIGAWGVILTVVMPGANAWLAALTGPEPSALWQWSVAFAGPFFLLLPATFAMGATLPAIERVTARLQSEGYAIGRLYAANTLGAVAGVLASAFVLIPALGLTQTALVCVALNMVCAAAVLAISPASSPSPSRPSSSPQAITATGTTLAAASPAASRRVLAVLAATGALGLGYEVVVVRVLSQVAQDTVYTFALLLAAYLIGTAGGAAFYQRRLAGRHDAQTLRSHLLCALAAACLAGTCSLWASEWMLGALRVAFGGGYGAALMAEAAIALAAFALPTLVMGALFSHLCVEATAAGRGFGTALAVNTFGAALAPLLFGVMLVPWLGPKAVLLAIGAGYLLLLPSLQWRRWQALAPALATAAVLLATPDLAFVEVPEGGRIVSYRNGVMGAVSVVEDASGVGRLRIDNRQQEGSNASLLSDARLAYLPMLLHPAPTDALFLGLGTGLTAASAAEDRSLKVDAVELLPEVIAAAPYFASALDAAPGTPGPHVTAGDARRYVRATSKRYDLIVADLFHPARSGAGALYTIEHFAAIRSRLREGGLFCQWLPLHQLDLATLQSITRSFMAVYPGASALLATNSLETPVIGLIGRLDDTLTDPAAVRQRLTRIALPARAAQLQLADDYAVLGSFIAGPAQLARFAGAAPLNTDDQPVVAHRAPLITYAPDSLPRQRLAALLKALQVPSSGDLLQPAGDDPQAAERQRQQAAYWQARTHFIEAGMAVQPNADPRAMLAQVQAPLLAIVRESPEFRPAYDPLIQLARALARSDAVAARALLSELAVANTSRPEAAQLLRQLGG
ncbi:hypothetical protein BH11PSE9_BH11PSE9_06370 [soil metagenome]